MSKQDLEHKGIALIQSWRKDWNKFISEALGVSLDERQRAIVAAVQHSPRVSVASGTARGKDFVAACCAICFLYLTPRWNAKGELTENTKVALTAPTDRQVKNIMLPEVARLYSRARQRGIHLPGSVSAYDIRTEDREWFLTGFKADEYSHEAWAGFHAAHTMFIVTEATGITDNTFAAIEGNLQGDSRILIVFNPNKSTGYAARSQKQERWRRFRLSSLEAPNVIERREIIKGQVNYEWVRDKVEQWSTPIAEWEADITQNDFRFEGQWYRPNDLFRVKVLGVEAQVAADVLIPQQWIEAAFARYSANAGSLQEDSAAVRVLGVDVAGMGRDSTCMVERKGQLAKPFQCFQSAGQASHMETAGRIRQLRGIHPDMYVSIDTIGEGAGVFSRLLEVDSRQWYISCKFSASASVNGKALTDSTGQYKFANMRAYLFWAVREWLDPKNNAGAMLPEDMGFMEEATETRYKFRSDGSIIIEPKEDIKKRLGRSPDKFDALANTFYPLKKTNAIDIDRLSRIIGRG